MISLNTTVLSARQRHAMRPGNTTKATRLTQTESRQKCGKALNNRSKLGTADRKINAFEMPSAGRHDEVVLWRPVSQPGPVQRFCSSFGEKNSAGLTPVRREVMTPHLPGPCV